MTTHDAPATDEGVPDPWDVGGMAATPEAATRPEGLPPGPPRLARGPGGVPPPPERATPPAGRPPELLELARGPGGFPPTREIASITDDVVDGVPVRIYRGEGVPTALVLYFHGGGYVMGSIGIMDNVAREL